MSNLQAIIDSLDLVASYVPDEHKPNLHKASEELTRLEAEVGRLTGELQQERESGDGWRWIREKFNACVPELTLPQREDSLAGTKYEVMGWMHVLCSYAQSANHCYLSIAVEQQKRAEEAEAANLALTARLAEVEAERNEAIAYAQKQNAEMEALSDVLVDAGFGDEVRLADCAKLAVAANASLEAEALTLRRQAAEILDEGPLFRVVSEILDGCAHHPNVEPDYDVIHKVWEQFTAWVRSTAALVQTDGAKEGGE
jgi:hypothetical protein